MGILGARGEGRQREIVAHRVMVAGRVAVPFTGGARACASSRPVGIVRVTHGARDVAEALRKGNR